MRTMPFLSTSPRWLANLALLLLMSVAGGCQNAPASHSNRTHVTGKVIWNDAPLTMGSITFVSAADPQQRVTGLIQADGTFALDDVPLGPTRVAVETASARLGLPPGQEAAYIELPPRFADIEQSGLMAEISSGAAPLEIALQP